ncbi:MAG: alanine racemase [Gammaproteobacteria bacterium]|nr:MAG: alanine racemase [Gammaproteobacteria bacterium]
MNSKIIKLRKHILFFALVMISLGGINNPIYSQVSPMEGSYPKALISHIADWHIKQSDRTKRPDTYIEINQKAFYDNILLVREELLNDTTKMMIVIKSDAYGHGLKMLGKVAEIAGADYFGITENSSIKIIKEMNLTTPVMRLRLASNNELLTVHSKPIEYGDVEEMVGNFQMVKFLSKLGVQQNRIIKIHLNLNAGGMSRNGFDMKVEKIRKQLLSISTLKNIKIAGIMTHFSNADAADIDETRTALKTFMEQSRWIIEKAGLNRRDILLHVANTSTTLRLPEAHLDMVRVGSLFYGEKLEKESPKALQQLMSVYSTVGQINFYPKGSSVGYGSNYILQRDSYLANIPIGKVNGIPRDLKQVLIGGKRYPTVGNMSMNTTMVDITNGWKKIVLGEEVVIFGKQGHDEIRVEEHWLGSISDIHSFMGQLNHNVRFSTPPDST